MNCCSLEQQELHLVALSTASQLWADLISRSSIVIIQCARTLFTPTTVAWCSVESHIRGDYRKLAVVLQVVRLNVAPIFSEAAGERFWSNSSHHFISGHKEFNRPINNASLWTISWRLIVLGRRLLHWFLLEILLISGCYQLLMVSFFSITSRFLSWWVLVNSWAALRLNISAFCS